MTRHRHDRADPERAYRAGFLDDLPIFAPPRIEPRIEPTRFHGATIEPELDTERLGAQYRRVFLLMRDGVWRTLREIAEATESPEASVSARLRDMRQASNGGHTVERRRRGEPSRGLHEYRVIEAGGVSRAPVRIECRDSVPSEGAA